MKLEDFVFGCPLYSVVELPADMTLKAKIVGYYGFKIDGHCPACGKESTFSRHARYNLQTAASQEIRNIVKAQTDDAILVLTCARNSNHKIRIWYATDESTVVKYGQTPSLADIANDEASTYRSVLDKNDSAELHKAIGLAAHGVGIGSFVYLRRIFERLVAGRFQEFKDVENWEESDFFKLKMDEKVKFLSGHLPQFLVENRKLYSVLSKGVHELSDDICLQAFEPIKLSIKIILEENKKKKEELDLKAKAAAAIANFQH